MNIIKMSNLAKKTIPFYAMLAFLVTNAVLMGQILADPNKNKIVPWLPIIFGITSLIYLWTINSNNKPLAGVAMFVIGAVVLGLSLLLFSWLSLGVIGSRKVILALIIIGTIFQAPIYYLLGCKVQSKFLGSSIEKLKDFQEQGHSLPSKFYYIFCLGLLLVLGGLFTVSAFSRDDIIGLDTPTYVFRARLIENFGITEQSTIDGGYQILFPLLSVAIRYISGLEYLDIVRILPIIIVTLICLSSGYFAHLVTRSWLSMALTTFSAAAWGLSPLLISDTRDNAVVLLFGLWALIFFTKNNSLFSEFIQGTLLVFAGLSHITLSIIFYLIIAQVNFMELFDKYWENKQELLLSIWKSIRVPLISGTIVLIIWSPVLGELLESLGFGLRTTGDSSVVPLNSFPQIMLRRNLTASLPWITLSLAYLFMSVFEFRLSRGLKVLFAWSVLCIFIGLSLSPISYLNERYMMMTPVWILIPLGILYLWEIGKKWGSYRRIVAQLCLIFVVFGMLLKFNLLDNIGKLSLSYDGQPTADYQRFQYINKYISTNLPSPPYIFLVESTKRTAFGYSDVWRRVMRSAISDIALTETHMYFGTLEYLLEKQQTPKTAVTFADRYEQDSFEASSERWFKILNDEGVFENQSMTIFIIDAYNEDTFLDYLFSPLVDAIGPGILVVSIPEDSNLIDQNTLEGNQ